MSDFDVPDLSTVSPADSGYAGEVLEQLSRTNTIPAEKVEFAFGPPNYANPSRKLIDRYVDDYRPLRVAVIGAGLAGVLAGALLPAKVPGIKLTIFEKNSDVVSDMRIRDMQHSAKPLFSSNPGRHLV